MEVSAIGFQVLIKAFTLPAKKDCSLQHSIWQTVAIETAFLTVHSLLGWGDQWELMHSQLFVQFYTLPVI